MPSYKRCAFTWFLVSLELRLLIKEWWIFWKVGKILDFQIFAIQEIILDTSKFEKLDEDPTFKREASLKRWNKKKLLLKIYMINCILPENLFIRNDDKIVALQSASLLFFNINKIILDITHDLNHYVQNCLVYPYSRKLEPWEKTLFSISHSLVSVTVFNSAK